jgi:hypothetical protein
MGINLTFYISFSLKYSAGCSFRAGLCCFAALTVINAAMPVRGEDAPAARQTGRPIPFSELGATVGAQYQGDDLSVVPAPEGARLRCIFQKLEGQATAEGLWLTSTTDGAKGDRFRVMAVSLTRSANVAPLDQSGFTLAALFPVDGILEEGWRRPAATCDLLSNLSEERSPVHSLLPQTGTVEVAGKIARFIRPGLTEEYSVSADGVRQDFVIPLPPGGEGKLRVDLDVTGAKAEALINGAQLALDGSSRKLAYNRLRAVDAQGRELPARLEAVSPTRLAAVVDDAAAAYPVCIDPTFSDANWVSMGGFPGASIVVYSTAVDNSGNLYISGSFDVVGEVVANCVAKWNGSAWSALGSGLNDGAVALAVSGTNLYAGGLFTTAGGSPANYIAKWNGSAWSALGSGLNGWVNALAVSGNDLYAGGLFTNAGGSLANHIARWDGSAWSALDSGLGGGVYALAVSGANLYAAGWFTTAGGSPANYVAKWDGSAWSALGLGLNDRVLALAVSGANLYAGGWFTMAGGSPANYIARWDGSAWSSAWSVFGSGLNGGVFALAASGANLYAGGWFTKAGGSPANYIAKWNGSGWSALGLGLSGPVYSLTASGANLYAGGDFTTAGGSPAFGIARWDGSAWSPLGSGFIGRIYALAVSGANLYVGGGVTNSGGGPLGGGFTNAGGSSSNYIIGRWDGSAWSALGSGLNGDVFALAVSGANLYVGGGFTTAGGAPATNIARWDGSAWSALGSGLNGGVSALAVSGTNLYVGGWFTNVGGLAANYIAKWNGSAWSTLGSGLNYGGEALAVSGNDLYVGGYFTTAGGSPANHIAKWDGSAWSALGSGLNYGGEVLAVSSTDLYVGGGFTVAGGKVSAYLARAILVPLPALNISFTSGNAAMISWPSSSTNFTLQQNPDLKTANWTAPSETVNDDHTNKFIIVNPAGASRFYRLVQP